METQGTWAAIVKWFPLPKPYAFFPSFLFCFVFVGGDGNQTCHRFVAFTAGKHSKYSLVSLLTAKRAAAIISTMVTAELPGSEVCCCQPVTLQAIPSNKPHTGLKKTTVRRGQCEMRLFCWQQFSTRQICGWAAARESWIPCQGAWIPPNPDFTPNSTFLLMCTTGGSKGCFK